MVYDKIRAARKRVERAKDERKSKKRKRAKKKKQRKRQRRERIERGDPEGVIEGALATKQELGKLGSEVTPSKRPTKSVSEQIEGVKSEVAPMAKKAKKGGERAVDAFDQAFDTGPGSTRDDDDDFGGMFDVGQASDPMSNITLPGDGDSDRDDDADDMRFF